MEQENDYLDLTQSDDSLEFAPKMDFGFESSDDEFMPSLDLTI